MYAFYQFMNDFQFYSAITLFAIQVISYTVTVVKDPGVATPMIIEFDKPITYEKAV